MRRQPSSSPFAFAARIALGILALLCPSLFRAVGASAAEEQVTAESAPRVFDDRLALELFAEAPDIVTPTGIAVDGQGRVMVIESHTHFRPDDYDGPPHDRVRVFEDTDGDGRADRIGTFSEGFTFAMDLAIRYDGTVYVATRNEILRLNDRDGDGRADQTQSLVRLVTDGVYPHNGVSGISFDFAGDLFFGLGENLGAEYDLIGNDGTTISGGGEGGGVFHVEADGNGLQRVATGFWNPFGTCLDVFGRLFSTDNDPGSSPPCRLLHVVPGGDYGYEYRYGRTGLHPLITWHGGLPGTLAMVAGTGEAPCKILAYESDGLPAEYRGELLVCSWGDHRVERYRLQAEGATYVSKRETLVRGNTSFRPVGIAAAPDGSLYLSDWGDHNYTLHGKGRLWHLRPLEPRPAPSRADDPRQNLTASDRAVREDAARRLARSGPEGLTLLRRQLIESDEARIRAACLFSLIDIGDAGVPLETVLDHEPVAALRAVAARAMLDRGVAPGTLLQVDYPPAVRDVALRAGPSDAELAPWLAALDDDDPFLRNAAITGLATAAPRLLEIDWRALPAPRQRTGVLLALKRSPLVEARDIIPEFLADASEEVRLAAVKWIADEQLATYRSALTAEIESSDVTVQLFVTSLAALDRIDGRNPRDDPDPKYLLKSAFDPQASLPLRRLSVRLLPAGHPGVEVAALARLFDHEDPELRLEAVRTLSGSPDSQAGDALARLATDTAAPLDLRSEAVDGLASQATAHVASLVALATGDEPTLRREALRSLIAVPLSESQRAALEDISTSSDEEAELVNRVLEQPRPSRPKPEALDAWLALVGEAGDAEAGRTVFFHSKLGACTRCHTIDGRGRRVGPDLSRIGLRATRRFLLESILEPSKEIAPQYVPTTLQTDDGRTLVGIPLRKGGGAGVEAFMDIDGNEFKVPTLDIVARQEQGISLMPTGVSETMTVTELRDLIAFLLQTR